MKMFKKTIALLAIIAIMVSTTAFAAFSDIATTQTATEIEAGDTFTIEATFDTLANAKGFSIEFLFDNTAFTIDTADDTEFNFGSNKKPVYWPNYIPDALKAEKELGGDGYCPFFGGVWDTFSFNATAEKVLYLSTDTSGTVMTAEDEADDMYPYRTMGVVFTANDDIEPGDYTFTINTTVSDATAGDVSASKTVKVTVKGTAPADPYTYTDAATTADELVLVDGPYTKKYTNVLVAKDSVAADTTAVDYGFVLVKEGARGAEISCKAAAVAGEGVLEFGIVMYNVTDEGVTAQKYVKAAQ